MQDNIVKTFIYLFFNFGSLGPPYKYITSDVTFAVTDICRRLLKPKMFFPFLSTLAPLVCVSYKHLLQTVLVVVGGFP